MKNLLHICFIVALLCASACNSQSGEAEKKALDYIRPIPGDDEPLPQKMTERGKVLVAYADCYTCHKEDKRSFGPAFVDVARRYPANKVFRQMLAQKIIMGGKGSWGNAVMLPHPKLSLADAEDMAAYVLSLDK